MPFFHTQDIGFPMQRPQIPFLAAQPPKGVGVDDGAVALDRRGLAEPFPKRPRFGKASSSRNLPAVPTSIDRWSSRQRARPPLT
jgi:hypothetical protein